MDTHSATRDGLRESPMGESRLYGSHGRKSRVCVLENGLRCAYSSYRRKISQSESGERRFHGRRPCVQLRRAILLRVNQAVWLEPR